MKLKVDLDKCIKSWECCYNHPGLMKANEDGFPVVQVAELTSDVEKVEAEQAAEVCPSQAISIVE